MDLAALMGGFHDIMDMVGFHGNKEKDNSFNSPYLCCHRNHPWTNHVCIARKAMDTGSACWNKSDYNSLYSAKLATIRGIRFERKWGYSVGLPTVLLMLLQKTCTTRYLALCRQRWTVHDSSVWCRHTDIYLHYGYMYIPTAAYPGGMCA